jgi:2-dehydropantoate 2-reductase
MRILIVGAGATGGAFGMRLIEAGRDVTFLVRPRRAEVLRRDGLRVIAPGEDRVHRVKTVTADELHEPYDLVIVTVKAPALESAIEDVRPAVGAGTVVLPILNGMAHMARLERAFPGRVVGGSAKIVATLRDGAVVQMAEISEVVIGAEAPAEVIEAMEVPGLELTVTDDIVGAMWDKWVFIAAAGAIGCLFRSPIGQIVEAGGRPQIEEIIAEVESVVAAAGHPVSPPTHQRAIAVLTEPGSAFTSSLYRDLVAGLPNEAEQILGDMTDRARALGVPTPLLDVAVVQTRAVAVGVENAAG